VNPFKCFGHNCIEHREMVRHLVGLMIVRFTLSKKIHLGVLYGNKGGIKMGNTDPHYAIVPTHGDEIYPSHLSSATTCRELAIQGSCLYLDSIISLQSGKIRSLK
jgi:hypothetical protein